MNIKNKIKYLGRLKQLREEKGLNQSDIAEILGVKSETYGKIERCQIEPKLSHLEELCRLYDCSIDYLLGKSDYTNADDEILGLELGLNDHAIKNIKSLYKSQPQKIDSLNHFLADLEHLEDFLGAFQEVSKPNFIDFMAYSKDRGEFEPIEGILIDQSMEYKASKHSEYQYFSFQSGSLINLKNSKGEIISVSKEELLRASAKMDLETALNNLIEDYKNS